MKGIRQKPVLVDIFIFHALTNYRLRCLLFYCLLQGPTDPYWSAGECEKFNIDVNSSRRALPNRVAERRSLTRASSSTHTTRSSP